MRSRRRWLIGVAAVMLSAALVQAVAGVAAEAKDKYIALNMEAVEQIHRPLLPLDQRVSVTLSLQDCISRALRHNLDVKIEAHRPAITLADVVAAEAAFDAVLFGSAELTRIDRSNAESGFDTRTDIINGKIVTTRFATNPFDTSVTNQYSLGVQQQLSTGATVALTQSLQRFENTVTADDELLFYNPFYQYSLEFSLRQPLLRDFGVDFNRAAINTARNAHGISKQAFNTLVIATVAEVETKYWRLVLARQQVKVYQALLAVTNTSLAKMIVRQQLDARAELIHRNRGQIARTEADLIGAFSRLQTQQDQLLESLNDPNLALSGNWEIIPADRPAVTPYTIARTEAMDAALQMRPELHQQRLRLDTAGIALGVAENLTMPRLDLFTNYEMTGGGLGTGVAWDQQWRANTADVSVGISFEVPLGGNRAAQAAYTKAKHQQRQERTRLESFAQQVLTDVSISLHTLENTRNQVAARTTAVEAESNTLLAYLTLEENEGKITSDFLDRKLVAQQRLATTLLQAIGTIFEYNVALMEAYRAQGLLLQYNNIKMSELRASD